MVEFKPRSSGVRNNRSAYCATTTAQWQIFCCKIVCFRYADINIKLKTSDFKSTPSKPPKLYLRSFQSKYLFFIKKYETDLPEFKLTTSWPQFSS